MRVYMFIYNVQQLLVLVCTYIYVLYDDGEYTCMDIVELADDKTTAQL